MITADPSNDRGDPRETMTRYNADGSWMSEVMAFQNLVVNDLPVQFGSSEDAIRTLALVYEIYYRDLQWRRKFSIADPKVVLDQLGIMTMDESSGG